MANTNFVWDYVNDCYLAEVDDSGNATAVYTNEPVRFGRVISQNRSGTTSYHHHDAQGSSVAMTDQNGDVSDTYIYNAFGEIVASSGAIMNPFRYIGRYGYYTDAETNDIYVRARSYKPLVGRWTSRDPLGFEGSELNLYEYANSRPLEDSDPSGMTSPPIGRATFDYYCIFSNISTYAVCSGSCTCTWWGGSLSLNILMGMTIFPCCELSCACASNSPQQTSLLERCIQTFLAAWGGRRAPSCSCT